MEQIILAICYERLVLRKNNTCYKYRKKITKKNPYVYIKSHNLDKYHHRSKVKHKYKEVVHFMHFLTFSLVPTPPN